VQNESIAQAETAGHQEAGPGGPIDEETGEERDALAAQIEQLNAEKADLTDRLVRAHAEIQNLHKRLEREREETAKYAIAKFARDTVAVADNFERAIMSVPEEALADNPVLKSLLDGVTMTEREFLNVLERHGVKRIDPKGEPFDPHNQQAMMEQEDPSVPAGTVLQVYQPGYMIADRVLRPAMVVVSKGGPKAGAKTAAAAADETDVAGTGDDRNGASATGHEESPAGSRDDA
jgi:molecular chaperone GrpE